ncbi:esterase PHB depolymerase [Clostridium homopropionicum DSM 5847]|uniref:Esterase PHB depolymerase n=1 Tax=Clostridium homopropionicum DSM 5847 TaxID=1121318 RepID=A0A0L6ZBX2_9CLOT|nr:PHB depolymerase family esterase [Clostridium homopropionicum]KOA20283.1 esterase PHB depolymerase [Clostridium homopropionicum DSM 5847]SFG79938.1 esterase, PHB depolymerase family [Clostridium homopropionicum]
MKSKGLKVLCARLALAFTLSLGFTSLSPLQAFATGTFTTITYSGREYKLYVPSGYTAGSNLPLVVMLHGCTQDPDQFAAGTQMNALAETENFLVMYPKQTTSANQNACWNFFEPTSQTRGSGEPALIAGMVNDVKSKYSVNNEAVFVTGLSAGGAMTAIMGATYPDVFKAISVGAGLEYKAATSMTAAFTAMSSGGPDPVAQGLAAYNAMGSYERVVPTMVWHGTSDSTVAPVNGNQVLTQWAETNDRADDGSSNNSIDDVADQTITGQVPGSSGRAYTRYIYNDANGNSIMEKYLVTGMGHAWSGGSTAGSYTDPNGPNQSQLTWEFFKSFMADTVAPVTTASPAGGFYTSAVNVTLTANEAATTYYTLDGTTPTTSSAVYSAPIVISDDSTLKYFSVDAAGNQEAVQTQVYQFGEDTIAPITTANNAGGTYTGSVNVTLSTNEAATTYYTLDGTTPTTSSAVYSAPITISADATLKYFSVDTAGNTEAVQTQVYNIEISYETATGTATEHYVAGRLDAAGYIEMGTKYGYSTPFNLYKVEGSSVWTDVNPAGTTDTTAPVTTVSPAGGTYTSAQSVTLTPNESATTYYTLDGTTPTTSSTVYSGAINISANTTLKFFSVDTAGNQEAVKTETYTIQAPPVDTTAPVTTASPAGGTYTSAQSVTLTPNESATTYYTLDGTTPTTSSTVYTGAINISANTTLKFFSVDTAGNTEAVKTESYTFQSAGTVFNSIDAEDGYVGQLTSDGYSTTTLKVGDKGMYNANTYYSILSFDTSSLGSASIGSAKLRIYRKALTGSVTGINVDIKSGYFGTSSALAQSDYSASASLIDVATGNVPASNNDYVDIPLSSLSLSYINKSGKTQFRLKGVSTTDSIADSLEIYGGDSTQYAPQLIITTN